MNSIPSHDRSVDRWPDYRAIWRWHFYASLFCIPFVILLSITGAIYLFKPQIDRWEDRAYHNLTIGERRLPADRLVQSAWASFPAGVPLQYQLPEDDRAAASVLIEHAGSKHRVFVHPETGAVLGQRPDQATIIRWVRTLHGQLHLGVRGSNLVELAASWTIVMLLTGLCLWWPRKRRGWGGILYPRLLSGGKQFWRDLHAVTGFWVVGLALFLIATGLPWAKFWGEYFRTARGMVQSVQSQDWTIGGEEVKAGLDPHAGHSGHGHDGHGHDGQPATPGSGAPRAGGRGGRGGPPMPTDLLGLRQAAETAEALALAYPVQIHASPGRPGHWTVSSDSQNRTLRVTCLVDGRTGEVVHREDFADRPLVDRLVSIGIAAHEGQLFGWPNQLLGLFTTGGLVLISLSGYVLWWRRRPSGSLGAPLPHGTARFRWPLLVTIVMIGVYLPLFGFSLILILLLERLLLRQIPPVRSWLGLSG